ncbi:MAG: 50S ribosomal protein L19 [Chloroflexota bacterium]
MDIKALAATGATLPRAASLNPGDTARVTFKIKDAGKERQQTFQGVVIKLKHGTTGSFTIRHVAHGVGVEHTFAFGSPLLQSVEVLAHGRVRRARLYYLRGLSAKRSRIKERRVPISGTETEEALVASEQDAAASTAGGEAPSTSVAEQPGATATG